MSTGIVCVVLGSALAYHISASLPHPSLPPYDGIVCGNLLHLFFRILPATPHCWTYSLYMRPCYTLSKKPLKLLHQTFVCSPMLSHSCISSWYLCLLLPKTQTAFFVYSSLQLSEAHLPPTLLLPSVALPPRNPCPSWYLNTSSTCKVLDHVLTPKD